MAKGTDVALARKIANAISETENQENITLPGLGINKSEINLIYYRMKKVDKLDISLLAYSYILIFRLIAFDKFTYDSLVFIRRMLQEQEKEDVVSLAKFIIKEMVHFLFEEKRKISKVIIESWHYANNILPRKDNLLCIENFLVDEINCAREKHQIQSNISPRSILRMIWGAFFSLSSEYYVSNMEVERIKSSMDFLVDSLIR